jgi:O-antigen ligase
LAAAAALPFRVPISIDGSVSNLLVPLYLVIGAAALSYALPRIFGDEPVDVRERSPHLLEWLLAAVVVLYCVQAIGSLDVDTAVEHVVFFYVPFALLFAQLARIDWTLELTGQVLAVLVVLALAFAAIGFVEYATRHLILNPKVIASNQVESYFRVNSLFFDPNIYGRFLAIVMLGVTAVVMWASRSRTIIIGSVVLLVLWAGLVLTLSQSSFASLLAGLAVLGALRWSVRGAVWGAGAAVTCGVLLILLVPGHLGVKLSSEAGANATTSGRYDLVAGGVRLAADRPLRGYGSGGFSRAYRRAEDGSAERAVSASHTTPVTVAAEQGVAGLLLYLALVAAALATLLRGAAGSPQRAAIAAAFVAIVVHSLSYAAFLEDPLTWVLLASGLVAALAAKTLRDEGPTASEAG